MSLAQDRLSVLVDWVKASSANEKAPLGKDTVVRGAFLVFIPQDLTAPPDPVVVAPEHLPLWIPESQAVEGLPPTPAAPTTSQPSVASRLMHLIWMFESERFQGALIALFDPAEPLQTALERQLPGLDLDAHPAIFLPLWLLGSDHRAWAEARLPFLR